ncbi:MAG: acyl-ACP--UDP-N-acetylglucosamine O-acyltransferase [bacterium]
MTKIHPSAIVHEGALLGVDVEIGPYSIIGPNVKLGDRTKVMPQVFLDGHTSMGAECIVFPFASIGSQTQDLKYKVGNKTYVEIGDRTTVREYVTINSGTMDGEVTKVGSGSLIMAYCHVAHGCKVGNRVIMANNASLSGDVLVEDDVVIGGMSGIHQFTRIGTCAMIGGLAKITQDVPPYMLVDGNPSGVHGINSVKLQRLNVSVETVALVKKAFKLLYREGLSTRQAMERIHAELPKVPEIEHLIKFIETSERGILK